MAKVKFTAGRISGFQCPEGKQQAFLWCDTVRGLAVRATAKSRANTYIFQAKVGGKTMRMVIGKTSAWGIPEAQAEARRLQVIIDSGNDPREVKAEVQAAKMAKREEYKRSESPALEIWDAYLLARTPRWSARSLLDHQRIADGGGKPKTRGKKAGEGDTTQAGILRPLLMLPLPQIDADRVRAWLAEHSTARPTNAALAFRLLRAFLNWCSDRPEYRAYVHVDACAARVARDELPKNSAKDDCLQREQLPLWFEHVRKLRNPVHSAYLQALLLTGARREELAGLRWEDCDFQWKSLNIRDKVVGQRMIPLTPYVASLLSMLPRRNAFVFSSPTAASGRLQEPRTGHNKALTAAGLPALSLHGLRRSFGTLAEWVECPAGVSAQIMGHKPSAIAEKHYRRRPLDLLRKWHCTIEAWILEQAGIPQPGETETGLRLAK